MSLERDLSRLARAIDGVLIAGHAQRHWLQVPHPPFRSAELGDRGHDDTDLVTAALRRYGATAAFDLWTMCRAIEELSLAWTGSGVVPVNVPPTPASSDVADKQ